MEINIRGHHFQLLSQKAILWKDSRTLLISDVHLGKISHFRKAGIAVPSAAYDQNFNRMSELISTSGADRIIFLGDLFHNRRNIEWEHFVAWRSNYFQVEMIVVLGNHDILPGSLFSENDIKQFSELIEGEFHFTHHRGDEDENNLFTFCGHIHPVYCVRSIGRQSIKLPGFIHDQHRMILPSFGVFTGGYEMDPLPGRKVYVVVENKVLKV